ncbi:MAG: Gfo/Idh/MocA family oxidoreductase [Bacteroidetes bacterium]|jgi:predicted dehydrogenase|nr:Gfo/Idh/MocA family oxidoreductase [Bacteroidota bacterium]
MGMIGGGYDSFIGDIHRKAAVLDGHIELVCGAFSSSSEKSLKTGELLYLPDNRVYTTLQEMMEKENALPDDMKMDFVTIVTPNHLHFEQAKIALQNNYHIVCDKPLCYSIDQAYELLDQVRKLNRQFCVTYTYTGYPMVKEARNMVMSGKLGNVRKVVVEYPQGWLSEPIEQSGQKQALWRTDPEKSGISCTMGDIGIHAANLAEFITARQIEAVCADLSTLVHGRQLDDDGSVFLRFNGNIKGLLYASQVSTGEENGLKILIYGTKGAIEWHQLKPDALLVKYPDKPTEIWRAGIDNNYLSDEASNDCRLPSGHPEGYIEAFANHYRAFAFKLQALLTGTNISDNYFPSIDEGVRGMQFIDAVVKSSQAGNKWVQINK